MESMVQTIVMSIIAGTLCLVLADRIRFPPIIFYLAAGIALGPHVAGLIQPRSLGSGLPIIVMLFVIIILFEGSLSLNLPRLRSLSRALVKQIAITIAITMPVAWICARYAGGMSNEAALILASLTVVTGPTVVNPIIRHLALRRHVKTFLNGEAVIIDAIGAVLAIMLLEYVVSKQVLGRTLLGFIVSLAAGIGIGLVLGFATKTIVRRAKIVPQGSRSFLVIGMLFLVYFLSESLARESGLMAAASFGITCSTVDYREKARLIAFKEQLSRIIIAFLFIILSSNFNVTNILAYAGAGMIIAGAVIASRFIIVWLSTIREGFSPAERIFMGWIGPRGIVALSVASISAMKLNEAGIAGSDMIEISIFILIGMTVILQGASAGFAARRLGINVSGDRNMIILGINEVTLVIAREWQKYQNDILFVDSRRDNCRTAAIEGFTCLTGNALDPATYEGIEMDSFSSALATTDNNEINILFCRFIKETYGIQNTYSVLTEKAGDELSDIILTEDIKLAYINSVEESSREGFFKSFIGLFRVRRPLFGTVILSNKDITGHKAGDYPLPEGIIILFVVRNSRSCHIYHCGLALGMGDVLHVMLKDEKMREELSILGSPPE